jgi:hypothetical protein
MKFISNVVLTEHSDLIIETDKLGLQQCVNEVIRFLLKQNLISTAFQPESDESGKIKP